LTQMNSISVTHPVILFPMLASYYARVHTAWMADSSSLDVLLLGGGGNAPRGRSRTSSLVISGLPLLLVAVTMVLGCLVIIPAELKTSDGARSKLVKPLRQAHLKSNDHLVTEVLEKFPTPVTVKQVNELVKQLPAHDQEDSVLQHIMPHAEQLFADFRKVYANTTPVRRKIQSIEDLRKSLCPDCQYNFSKLFTSTAQDILDDNYLNFKYRLNVFTDTLRTIVKQNNFEARHSLRPDRAVFGINKFADWTWSEFETLLLQKTRSSENRTHHQPALTPSSAISDHDLGPTSRPPVPLVPPCSQNWVAKYPALFQQKNQESSSLVWTLLEELRAMAFINTGADPGELAEQYVHDCMLIKWGERADGYFTWIQKQGGIPKQSDYSWYRNHSVSCIPEIPKAVNAVGVDRFRDENKTALKLCSDGPLTMRVYASSAWQTYVSGVLSHYSCPAFEPNHDVQVVAVLPNESAWVLRNPFGSDYGVSAEPPYSPNNGVDGGYILLEFGHNTCNCENEVSFPRNVSCVGSCSDALKPAPTPAPVLDEICTNECTWSFNDLCEDGGPGSYTAYAFCKFGTDSHDCGCRNRSDVNFKYLCTDDCKKSFDGKCEDGGPDSVEATCELGTDCYDCGRRVKGD